MASRSRSERGAKVSGARGSTSSPGSARQLQLGLLQLAVQQAVAAGFTLMIPPVLIRPRSWRAPGSWASTLRRCTGCATTTCTSSARRRCPLRVPRRRDPRPHRRVAPLRRLVVVLPPRVRVLRQGHPRHHPGAPVRQGRDARLLRPGRRRGRARAPPRLGGADARRHRAVVPGHRRLRRQSGVQRGAQVRARGVVSQPGHLPRAHVHVELHHVPVPAVE